MPTPKQMEKLAAAVGREPRRTPNPGPGDAMPPEYWESVLRDPLADASPMPPGRLDSGAAAIRNSPACSRVACSRCGRTVEIQKADAVRLYGPDGGLEGRRSAAAGQHLPATDRPP